MGEHEVEDSDVGKPWAQQPLEPNEHYLKFRKWLLLDDRVITRAYVHLGLTYGTLHNISGRWKWRERADAWDREQLKEFEAETKRNRNTAAALLSLAIVRASAAKIDKDGDDIDAQEIQRLTAALKNLAPGTEISASVTAEDGAVEDVVALAIRKAREVAGES